MTRTAERGSQILVVDDDPQLRELVRELCQSHGYEAVEARTGREAIAAADSHQPDLVLLDWKLPDLSGLDVCDRLRQRGFLMPIVIITGRSADEDVEAGLRAGADDYMVKPLSPRQLPARIAAHLRRAGVSAAAMPDRDAERRLGILEQVSIFFMQAPGVVRRIAGRCTAVPFRSGEVLLRAGTANDVLRVIAKGRCEVTLEVEGGTELPIALLGPLDLFGACSVVSAEPARATVTAVEAGELLLVPKDELTESFDDARSFRSPLRRVAEQRQSLIDGIAQRTRMPSGEGRMIAVYSPKGGAGKTTLALNLAAALAEGHPGEVALLDLGLPYSDAALLAGLAPTTCLARLGPVSRDFDALVLSAALQHPARFFLIPVALKPEESDLVTAEAVTACVAALRRDFRYVVVDCPVHLSDAALSVVENANTVVLITTPRLPVLKDVPHLLQIFENVLRRPAGTTHLVVNHPGPRPAITREDIENVAGRPVLLEVGFDPLADRAALEGDLLWSAEPRGPVAQRCRELAQLVTAEPTSDRALKANPF
jgi:pilus assembly protein CpaE